MPGCTHDRRRHVDSFFSSLQRIWYMFAVGPPRSVMTPFQSPCAAHRAHLAQDAVGRAVLDDAPFVLGDAAEGAAAEAAAHGHDRVLHRLERRHRRVAVHRVRRAVERQVVELVHVGGLERQRRRVEVDAAAIARRAAAAGARCAGWSRSAACATASADFFLSARTSSYDGSTTTRPSPTCCDGLPASCLGLAPSTPARRCRACRAAARSSRRRAGGARSPRPGRSPMPKTSRSALASSRIERRTVSDQ